MKKLFLLPGFVLVALFSPWAAAQDLTFFAVSGSIDQAISEPANLVTPLPAESRVIIRLTADGHLAAWVNDDPAYAQTAFLLQTTTTATLTDPIILSNARIDFSGTCVTFRSSTTGQSVRFQLSGTACSNTAQGTTVFQGVGLSKQSGDALSQAFVAMGDGAFPPMTAFNCHCNPDDSSDRACDSGGMGATACSTGSSGKQGATACGTGWYACCKN